MTLEIVARQSLADRTAAFSDRVRDWIALMPRTLMTIEDLKQLLRSSGSVSSNYIEACEATTAKDCTYRLKICRKEARESELWLRLLGRSLAPVLEKERRILRQEAHELKLIFNAIIQKRMKGR